MEQAMISGTLTSDVETAIDKNGKKFIRFVVVCGSNDTAGRAVFTRYHCTSFLTGYSTMKKGDQVVVIGRLIARIAISRDDEPILNLTILATAISRGYTAVEKMLGKKANERKA